MDHLNSLPFIITEEDLKRKKMNQEKLEELKSKISIDIEVNRENQDDNSSENEEEDEDFKLEEKIEL